MLLVIINVVFVLLVLVVGFVFFRRTPPAPTVSTPSVSAPAVPNPSLSPP